MLFAIFITSLLIPGVASVECYSYESAFSSTRISFTCPASCCPSSNSQECCDSSSNLQVWSIIVAIIVCLMVLGCIVAVVILWLKACTRTAWRGRVISPSPVHTMRMPQPPPYSAPGANPPPYTVQTNHGINDPDSLPGTIDLGANSMVYHPLPQPVGSAYGVIADVAPTDNTHGVITGGVPTDTTHGVIAGVAPTDTARAVIAGVAPTDTTHQSGNFQREEVMTQPDLYNQEDPVYPPPSPVPNQMSRTPATAVPGSVP